MLQKQAALVLFSVILGIVGHDITEVPEFGCRWTGGSISHGVTCTCQDHASELVIEKGAIPSYDTVRLRIQGCNFVRFGSNAISNMRNLRNIELSNIKNLYFEDFSLSWNSYLQTNNDFYNSWDGTPTLKVHIEKCIIQNISSYTFQGRISSIIFRESNVIDMAPFAFSSLTHNQHIEFLNVNFSKVQAQALKKFPTEFLIISDSTFNMLPSRSFSDVIVLDTFQIRNCSFGVIKPSGFFIQNPKRFELANSNISELEGEGFKVTTRGSVKIRNNVFNYTAGGGFLGISLNKEEVPNEEEIWFDSNTFVYFSRRSFEINTTSFNVKYTNILIKERCDCRFRDYGFEENEFQCFLDGKRVTINNYIESNCSVLASYTNIFIILGVTVLLFIIILSGLLIYFKRTNKRRKEHITDKNGKAVSLIMPDGRTYRETELHVIVERADLLTTDL